MLGSREWGVVVRWGGEMEEEAYMLLFAQIVPVVQCRSVGAFTCSR